MNNILNTILLVALTLFIIGCDGNYSDIELVGLVTEKSSGVPVEDAEIIINCWVYDLEIWESKAVKKSTKTDSNGKFVVNFKKGEALDITVKSENHDEFQESITLKKSTNNFDIKLTKTN